MVDATSRQRRADDALATEAAERRECRERPLNFQKMASGPHECAFAIRQIELDPLPRWWSLLRRAAHERRIISALVHRRARPTSSLYDKLTVSSVKYGASAGCIDS